MSDHSNTKSFFFGALFGGLAGGLVALLFAPKSGKQLREDICRKCGEASDKAHEFMDEAGNKIKEYVEDGKEAVRHLVDNTAETAKDVKKEIKK